MVHDIPWEADLWVSMFQKHIHMRFLLHRIPSQLNLVHTFTLYLSKIYLNIILLSTSTSFLEVFWPKYRVDHMLVYRDSLQTLFSTFILVLLNRCNDWKLFLFLIIFYYSCNAIKKSFVNVVGTILVKWLMSHLLCAILIFVQSTCYISFIYLTAPWKLRLCCFASNDRTTSECCIEKCMEVISRGFTVFARV